MMTLIQSAVILILLLIASVSDIKTRYIPNWISICIGAAAFIDFHAENLWGLFVALIVFITALRGGICGGDVKIFTALSLSCGIYGTLLVLFVSEITMLMYYGVCDIVERFRHKRAEKAWPFLPFITIGYISLIILKGFITI